MLLTRTHKVRLLPNDVQATYLLKCAGTARFAYNWALDQWKAQMIQHNLDPSRPRPVESSLRKQLNSIKGQEFPWMLEVTKSAPQQAIKDLGAAYKNFFEGRANKPKFKRKGDGVEGFYLDNTQVRVSHNRLKIPKLKMPIKMAETVRWPEGKLLGVRISKRSGDWHCSFTYQIEQPTSPHLGPPIGCDLGVRNLGTLSNGTVYENRRPTASGSKRLRQLNKQLSRRQVGSKNHDKAKRRLQRQHARIKNQRLDTIHKMTKQIAETYSLVGLETLSVSGMVKNRCMAKSVLDASMYEITRQLLYKVEASQGQVHRCGRFFPSSKLCNQCGVKNQDLRVGQQTWVCTTCGAMHDRDVNAAINLLNEAVAASSAVIACGEESSGIDLTEGQSCAKLSSVKQELNSTGFCA